MVKLQVLHGLRVKLEAHLGLVVKLEALFVLRLKLHTYMLVSRVKFQVLLGLRVKLQGFFLLRVIFHAPLIVGDLILISNYLLSCTINTKHLKQTYLWRPSTVIRVGLVERNF
jgi:hypothetical protein